MNACVFSRFLHEAVKGPAHIVYCLKNIHLFRDHFPNAYARCHRLDLGGPSGLTKLHVLLRTTDSVLNLNVSRQLDEIGLKDKRDVVKRGGLTIFRAARKFADRYGAENLTITLVADRLTEEGLFLYREAAEANHIEFSVVAAKGSGNGPTFQTQVDVALEDGDDVLELFLEDDYMLDEDALVIPFGLLRAHSNVAGCTPHFHPDRIRRQDAGKLVVVDGRLYARTFFTCCTFFITHAAVRRYLKHLRMYSGWEDGSINEIWRRSLCLSPLGWTLAEHLHRSELSPVQKLLPMTTDERG